MDNLLIKLLSNRIFVVSVLLGLISLSIFFIYYFFPQKKEFQPEEKVPLAKEEEIFKPTPASTQEDLQPAPASQPSPEISPEPAFGQVEILNSQAISSPWISADGKLIKYLSKSDFAIYEFDIERKKEEKVLPFAPNLIKILWSPDGYHLINIFRQNKYFYNLFSGENILLNKNIKYVVWSPEGNKIAYHYFNPETEDGFLSLADPDGKNWQNLMPVAEKELKIDWPKSNKISFYQPSFSPQEISQLKILDPESGIVSKEILLSKSGLQVKWSPSGTKILISGSSGGDRQSKISIFDENLKEKSLNLEGLAEKCVWSKSEKYIFCALPQNLTEEILLPWDWYSEKFISRDLLFKIDLETKERTQITQEAKYDFSNLFLAPDESYLYFIDKRNNLLHSVKL